jgi:hypothetical protein
VPLVPARGASAEGTKQARPARQQKQLTRADAPRRSPSAPRRACTSTSCAATRDTHGRRDRPLQQHGGKP